MNSVVQRVAKALTLAFQKEACVFQDEQAEALACAAIDAVGAETQVRRVGRIVIFNHFASEFTHKAKDTQAADLTARKLAELFGCQGATPSPEPPHDRG